MSAFTRFLDWINSEVPSADTLTGAEKVPLIQTSATKYSLLSTIADYVVKTATSFLQSGTGAIAITAQTKMRDLLSITDFSGATTNAKIEAAVANLAGAKGVILVPNGTAADSAAPTVPETATVLDFRGDANPPNETTQSYSGVNIDINSTSMGMVTALSAWQKRSSPTLTSAAFLGTSFYTGTLPDAQTLGSITAWTNTLGAITPGTGVITSFEAYTSIQSTGGTIADVRGVTSSVNITRAAATSNITTASSIYAQAVTNSSASGAVITNAYGLYAAAQTAGGTRNYSIYNEGVLLQNHQQRWDALDKDGNIVKVVRFGTGAANNNILVSGLTDALGWKFTDQAGTALYAHLTSAGIGWGVDPAYPLHITKSAAADIVAKIANTSATGYGLAIAAGTSSNYAISVADYTDGAQGFLVTGSGKITINNTVNAVSPTSPNRTITMDIGGATYFIHAKTTND